MTPEELADVLEKADTVRDAKVAYEAKAALYNVAYANATAARASWLTAVDAGQDATTLTALFNQYVTTSVAEQVLFAERQALQSPWALAGDALLAAANAIIAEAMPEPP